LLVDGALDVWLTPVLMKKGRPGHVLSVLCEPSLAGVLATRIRRETGSLGVRKHDVSRSKLQRAEDSMETSFGPVRVKRIAADDGTTHVRAETDDVVRIAGERDLPFLEVLQQISSELANTSAP
jgi:uncharacterized protein (DUF111 family)